MSIKLWPDSEKPREKLLVQGAESLSDAELLAIFLRTGCHGKSAVDVARDCLLNFGGLRQLLHASIDDFCAFPGIGTVKYCTLQAALELGKRYLEQQLKHKPLLNKTDATLKFLTAKLRDSEREIFACLFLDCHYQLICYEELSQGTIDQSRIYPREIVKTALKHNAANVLFAHNHPSGISEASDQDITLTTHLKKSLALVDIDVVDHIIIGENSSLSFLERGWL
jgi:DNA repair protein RadC